MKYSGITLFQYNDAPYDGAGWGSTTHLIGFDASYADCNSLSLNALSWKLHTKGYEFSIPAGATILGVKAEIKKMCNGYTGMWDSLISLATTGGSIIGDNKKIESNDAYPSSNTIVTYGGEDDLWGAELTPTIVNDSGFGLIFASVCKSTGARAYVDGVRLTIYYST